MSIIFEPAVAGTSRGWTLLLAPLQRLFSRPAVDADDRQMASALRTLSGFDERELNDIGLSRSDLTPEGLTIAGARRARQQAAIDADIAALR